MIRYSERAKVAISALTQQGNDIDIFVEDASLANIYITLANLALAPKFRVTRVHAIGSRTSVIDACSRDQDERKRPRLYIIDGDCEHIIDRRHPKLRHLLRWSAYCIENILITPRSILDSAWETSTMNTREEVADKLDIVETLDTIERAGRCIYRKAAIALICGTQDRIHPPPLEIIDTKGPAVSVRTDRLRAHLRELSQSAQRASGREEYLKARARVRQAMPSHANSLLDMASGKHFIFPVINSILRGRCGEKSTNEALLMRFARHTDHPQLRRLGMMLRSRVKSRTNEGDNKPI